MRAPRLYYLDDIPTPYRLGVQQLIAERWKGTFHLAFCAESEPGRTFTLDFRTLNPEYLRGLHWRPPHQTNPFSFKWNPGVVRSLRIFSPDVVILSGYAHPTMWRAARWCITNRIPYAVCCETSCRCSVCSGWRWKRKQLMVGWMIRNMSFGLPVGREAADYLRSLGRTDVPMHYFPNTPDTRSIVEEAERLRTSGEDRMLRESMGIPLAAPILLFVGRLIAAKRPADAVNAFRDAVGKRNTVLVIVGDGEEMTALREAAAGDPRILFVGWIKDAKRVAGLMSIATALLLPSEHEPWGAVVNEAMAAGTPVISSDRVGSSIELIEHGVNGLIVRVGDVAALSQAIRQILHDPVLAASLGTAASKTAFEKGESFAVNNLISGAYTALERSTLTP